MSLEPYPKYRDSGIRWIGQTPEEWKIYKLKHLVNEFISGGTPSSDNEKFWSREEELGIYWVAIGDMTNNDIITDTAKKITLEGLADKRLRILKKGTLIYSIFASLGKVSELGVDATTNQAILGLITSNRIQKQFLKYYLNMLEEPIIVLSNANTQNNLNSTIVKNIFLAIPEDIELQKIISKYLDLKIYEIKKTIEKDKRLIMLIKEKRTALINHVVTKGLDPNAIMKDSKENWFGEIPKGWEIVKLKHIAIKITQGPNPNLSNEVDQSAYKLLKTKDVYDNEIKYESSIFISEEEFNNNINARLNDEDILITIVGQGSIGKVNIFRKQDEEFIFTRAIALVRPNLTKAYPSYIKFFFESRIGKEMLNYIIDGSTGQEVIKTSNLKEVQVILPTRSIQKKLTEYLIIETSKIDNTIQKIEEKINLLEEYKKSLIHHVVTGKVDVRSVAV